MTEKFIVALLAVTTLLVGVVTVTRGVVVLEEKQSFSGHPSDLPSNWLSNVPSNLPANPASPLSGQSGTGILPTPETPTPAPVPGKSAKIAHTSPPFGIPAAVPKSPPVPLPGPAVGLPPQTTPQPQSQPFSREVSGEIKSVFQNKMIIFLYQDGMVTKDEKTVLLSDGTKVYEMILKDQGVFEKEHAAYRAKHDISLPTPQMAEMKKSDRSALVVGKRVAVVIDQDPAASTIAALSVKVQEY